MTSKEDKIIAQSLRNLVTKMNKRLRKQMSNPEQLSIAEHSVVSLLMSQKEMLPSELGGILNISSQFMSQVLNRLEGLKYISKKASPNDGRKTLVSLTDFGRTKIENSRQEREEWLAENISKKYTRAEKEIIKQALDLLEILPDL